MPIDTLEASKRLKDLGFDSAQAEGLAELLADLDVAGATKEDLDDTEERLLQRINQGDEARCSKTGGVMTPLASWI